MPTTKALTRIIIRKAANSVVTLFLVIIFNFVLFRLMPGNPINAIVPPDPKIPAEYKEHLIEEYGLDEPLYVQFFTYIKDTLLLKFGDSFADPGTSAMSIDMDNLEHLIEIFGLLFRERTPSALRRYNPGKTDDGV